MTQTTARAKLAKRIHALREKDALTLAQLSDLLRESGLKAGYSVSHLSAIETNQAWPSPELTRALEHVLHARDQLMPLLAQAKVSPSAAAGPYRVQANLYFPLFLGREQASQVERTSHPSLSFRWLPPRSVVLSEGPTRELYVFDSGVAVACEAHRIEADSLVEVARWRSSQIARCGTAGVDAVADLGFDVPAQVSDTYCLATLELLDAPWDDEEQIDRSVQILANPSVLASPEPFSPERDQQLEAKLLSTEGRDGELSCFSVTGHHLGWASWAGVSTHVFAANSPLAALLHEYEVQLQGLWCLASTAANDPGSHPDLARGSSSIRSMLRTLRKPDPTEHVAQRSLREALIRTSRIEDVVRDACDALDDARQQDRER